MNLINSKELDRLCTAKMVSPPASHTDCMVCGKKDSLKLCFRANENGVEALFQAGPHWQGYRGVLHGGMISTLLDAAMTHCLFHYGIEAMTADLRVRFFRPIPCSHFLELRAMLLDTRRHLYKLRAELCCAGDVMAKAEGKFMRSPVSGSPQDQLSRGC